MQIASEANKNHDFVELHDKPTRFAQQQKIDISFSVGKIFSDFSLLAFGVSCVFNEKSKRQQQAARFRNKVFSIFLKATSDNRRWETYGRCEALQKTEAANINKNTQTTLANRWGMEEKTKPFLNWIEVTVNFPFAQPASMRRRLRRRLRRLHRRRHCIEPSALVVVLNIDAGKKFNESTTTTMKTKSTIKMDIAVFKNLSSRAPHWMRQCVACDALLCVVGVFH